MNPTADTAIPFPTLAEVEAADQEKLAYWYRFLVSPATAKETAIMKRMMARFHAGGGWTPAVSKAVNAQRDAEVKHRTADAVD